MSASVTVHDILAVAGNTPRHSLSKAVIQATVKLVEQALNDHNFNGDFELRPLDQITMKGNVRFRLGTTAHGRLRLKIKPGDNSTAHEWELKPPSYLSAETLYKALKADHIANGDVDNSLSGRIGKLEAVANEYNERFARIKLLEQEIEGKMRELEAMQAEHAADTDGAEAGTLLATLCKLTGLTQNA